jgi:hypothetical protein
MTDYRILVSVMKICRLAFAAGMFGAWVALSFAALAGAQDDAATMFRQAPSDLKPLAIAPGQRLQKTGRERISATGTIAFPGDGLTQVEPIRLTLQYPLKIRLDMSDGRWIVDRRDPARRMTGKKKIADAIQVMLEDSVEGFFALQKSRISRRYYGSGFTLEGARESDPGMDVYVLTYPDVFSNGQPIQKSYWFDSRTKLLGVVAYTSLSGATTHVVLDDWRDVQGEKLPFRIERWENNKLTMHLVLGSAAIAPAAEDGTFGAEYYE